MEIWELDVNDKVWALMIAVAGNEDAFISNLNFKGKAWKLKHTFTDGRHTDAVYSICYSPHCKYLASGSKDNTIKVWALDTGMLMLKLRGHDDAILSVSYSPHGDYLASGSADNTIKIWDLSTNNCIQTLTGDTGPITSVSYSFDSDGDRTWLASSSLDNTIKIWDTNTSNVVRQFTDHSESIAAISESFDGSHLNIVFKDNSINTLDIKQELR
jgi:WD40 repeat protein